GEPARRAAAFVIALARGWTAAAWGQAVHPAPPGALAAIGARAALRAPQLTAEPRALPATLRPARVTDHDEVGYVLGAPVAAANLRWSTVAEKARAIRIELTSENATALRISLRRDRLPRGMEVRFYAPGGDQAFGPYWPAASVRGEEWWSPIITGSRMGVEFYLGSGTAGDAP